MKADPKNRIFELDALRGIALMLMCIDHLLWDLSLLPEWFPASASPVLRDVAHWAEELSLSRERLALHYVFATLFLLLAGIGSSLTKHPWKRCGRIAAAAVAVTVGTVLADLWFDLGCTILFGVLSAMAVGALACAIVGLLPEKWGKYAALWCGVAVIAVGFSIKWYAPRTVYYLPTDRLWDVVCGTVRYGADWFPVFPCCGVILVGFFLGKLLYADRRSKIPALRGKTAWICAAGRHPLAIYLLHQPILAGLLYLIFVWF